MRGKLQGASIECAPKLKTVAAALRPWHGKKTIEQVIQQLAVELKADTIRLLERASNSDASEAPSATDDDVPL